MLLNFPFFSLMLPLLGLGIMIATRGSLLTNWTQLEVITKRCDTRETLRLAAALDRRSAQEHIEKWEGWGSIAAGFVIAWFCFRGNISVAAAITLQLMVLLAGTAIQLLRLTRVSSARRVATLTPRNASSVIPMWFLVFPAIAVLIDVYYARTHQEYVALVIAAIGGAIALVSSFMAATTPAILGDEDRVADEIVDAKVRGSRIRQLLLLAAYAPLLWTFFVEQKTMFDPILRLGWLAVIIGMAHFSARLSEANDQDLQRLEMVSQ